MKNLRIGIAFDIACLAFLVRFAVSVYIPTEPVWDGHYYAFGAERIAHGFGYSEDLVVAGPNGTEQTIWHPWAHYPVGYSAFLALFFRVFGMNFTVASIANACTGAALAAVVYMLAAIVYSPSTSSRINTIRSVCAGLMVALHPGLVLYSGALMTEPLAAFGMFSSILWIVCDSHRIRRWIFAGIILGLTTLVRPNAILIAPFLALITINEPKLDSTIFQKIGTYIRKALLVSSISILTVLPWTIRNCRRMDACAFVSTNGGWNLVIGSAPGATGKFEFLVGNIPKDAPACDQGGQVEQDRCWLQYGIKTIRKEPTKWLSLIPSKLHYTLDFEWFPINYLREARPDKVSAQAHIFWGRILTALQCIAMALSAFATIGIPTFKTNHRSFLRIITALFFQFLLFVLILFCIHRGLKTNPPFLWTLAVIACVVPYIPIPGLPKRHRAEYAVLAILLTTLVTHAIFFGEDRYHLVVTPVFLFLIAGLGRKGDDQSMCLAKPPLEKSLPT